MALNIGRKHRSGSSKWRLRPQRSGPGDTTVERKPRRWARGKTSAASMMIMAAGWTAVAILGLGMLLTWGEANPGNVLVDGILDVGRWLATPFHDIFTRTDPQEQLYINWAIAAGAYYLLAKLISFLVR
ncbi:hypothetical protein [Spirillospora sp. CA-294931]|uniref:hypothetical protein n=1 Tax=Spirillospora sp. CA-294931 TaxID=3240042 RepID=UPI003D8B5BB5